MGRTDLRRFSDRFVVFFFNPAHLVCVILWGQYTDSLTLGWAYCWGMGFLLAAAVPFGLVREWHRTQGDKRDAITDWPQSVPKPSCYTIGLWESIDANLEPRGGDKNIWE